MKVREYFQNFFGNVKTGIQRYLIAFICSVLCFFTISYEILFETGKEEIIVPLCMTYALVALFSVLLKTTQEYLCQKLNSSIQYGLCTLTAIAGFLLIEHNYESLYTIMAYSGIMVALLCFIFFILMRGANRDLAFPKLVASFVFTGAVCGVLSGGLSTCIAAFQSLIFTWDSSYKLYLIVNLFVWVIGFPNIFLSFIPKTETPVSQSKIFRIFVLFAGLPLYILLIAILLIYLAKIVITLNMPVGEINWFASFASLFFIFFVMSVMQYTEKLAKLFIKYGGYFLIPVLIMQAIAVFERINAYGLTTPRTISLVLIAISILFIGGAIISPKHLNKVALISGMVVLLVTVTPWNVIDMPVASQTAILKNTLIKNNMIKDGVVIPNKNVSDEDAKSILSAYNYLKYNARKTPDFIPNSEKDFPEIFGFSDVIKENGYEGWFFQTKASADITDYNQMVKVYAYDEVLTIDHNGQQYNINLYDLAQELYQTYGSHQSELDIYRVNENVGLYMVSFTADLENGNIVYSSFSGYALLKD